MGLVLANDRIHIVVPEETLSQIARLYYSIPIYGPQGSLQLILRLNPEIKNKHRIYPRQKILIRDGTELERSVAEEAVALVVEPMAVTPADAQPAVVTTPAVKPLQVQVSEASLVPPAIQKVVPPTTDATGFNRHSSVSTNIGFSFLALDGYDPDDGTSGHILSKLTPAVEVAWNQFWSSKLATKLFLRTRRIEFEPESSSTVSIKNSSITNSTFGIGVSRSLSSRWLSHFNLGMAQALFYRATAASTLEINQKPVLKVSAAAEYEVLDLSPFKIAASGGLSYWSGSSYDNYSIKAGFGYHARLTMKQTMKFYELLCGIGYSQRRQDTSILELTEKEVGLDCGLAWELK